MTINIKDPLHIIGVIATTDSLNRYGVNFSKECLVDIAEKANMPFPGYLYEYGIPSSPPTLADVAFKVSKMEVEDNKLTVNAKVFPNTVKGNALLELLEVEKKNTGTLSMGMAGLIEKETEDDGGVRTVSEFRLDRVSIFPSSKRHST